ncbi:uncharacterized protein LOC113355277 [Papaver somniferum]|uniref:uncharacterized protein LOC113355277 n=1 Tax=Papaver somniferum TaxID=3469 RepID=UPI000E6FE0A8|nr:uncharacterized protein LOC113355277 [Papaver somniferum]
MESYPVAVSDSKGGNTSLLPRLTNAVASTSEGNQGRNNAEMEQNLVSMGSAGPAEFDKEYRDKQLQNRGGKEPPPGRMSKEFCVYHRFHGHTTSKCRNVRKIILRMIEQGKLDHFLLKQPRNLPLPPPQGNTYANEKDGSTFVIEVGAKENNLYCNSIIHSFKNIEDFHDNVLSRVYARDAEGREILNLAKVSLLKEWKKQKISFSADETPGGGELHECPLVVRLGINPKPLEEDEEENEKNTWAINRILIDTGSSVDIVFYHTYKTMGGRDDELIPSTYKIYGFNSSANKPKGEVTMRILVQNLPTDITFCVVDVEPPYNALIGRP